ncbi:hypothetical protein [Candidatus Parabeggiatoa sp. HSG14]|uniref:hypothetical protein n=1 Tax=Candidatus Parabeggiatoa sp. HSG14 TaxID=3055593 RepID=UPI0032E460E0
MANVAPQHAEQLGVSIHTPHPNRGVGQFGLDTDNKKATYQQLVADKQELEDIMAMVAHKFLGALISLEYNVEHQNQKKTSLDSIKTMRGLLNLFGIISTDSERLRQELSQDMYGECTLLSVLEKSLSLAFTQLLTIGSRDKIIQHYLSYAKKTEQILPTTTRKQWRNNDDHLALWRKLQTEWETSFMQLPEPSLANIVHWTKVSFFPIEVNGFDNNPVQFKRYGVKELVLMIVLTEIILNAIKYYSSETNEPIKLRWICQKNTCQFICENPTSKNEQEMGKGSYKGHKFLNIIFTKLGGYFSTSTYQNYYVIDFSLPIQLLTTTEVL